MERIKDTVKEVMAALAAEKNIAADEEVAQALKKILGTKEKNHVKLGYFRKGVLGLAVDSSAWLYHLNLQKEKLLAKLTRKTKGVKSIRLYITDTL